MNTSYSNCLSTLSASARRRLGILRQVSDASTSSAGHGDFGISVSMSTTRSETEHPSATASSCKRSRPRAAFPFSALPSDCSLIPIFSARRAWVRPRSLRRATMRRPTASRRSAEDARRGRGGTTTAFQPRPGVSSACWVGLPSQHDTLHRGSQSPSGGFCATFRTDPFLTRHASVHEISPPTTPLCRVRDGAARRLWRDRPKRAAPSGGQGG